MEKAVQDAVDMIDMEEQKNALEREELTSAETMMEELAISLKELCGQLAQSQGHLEHENDFKMTAVEAAKDLVPSQDDHNTVGLSVSESTMLTLDRQTLVEMVTEMQESVLLEKGLVKVPSDSYDFVSWYKESIKKLQGIHWQQKQSELGTIETDTAKNAHMVSEQKGNQVILTLFWQLINECSKLDRISESAFSAEEMYKWIDKTNSGKVTRVEFQNFAASVRLPFDSETMGHIYDLIASNDGLGQAEFVQMFGNFAVREGLELLPQSKPNSVLPKQNLVLPIVKGSKLTSRSPSRSPSEAQSPVSAAATPGGPPGGPKSKPSGAATPKKAPAKTLTKAAPASKTPASRKS